MNDTYLSYTSIQLAGEESFICWVLHGENEETWLSWTRQHEGMSDKIEEARQIVLSLSGTSQTQMADHDKKALWSRINTSILTTKSQPVQRRINPLWTWGFAAAATLALLIWVNTGTSTESVYAMAGEHKEVSLPEESTVTINAKTFLAYKEKSFEENRVIELSGEAFFKVKPGSTFTVKSDHGSVTVLGTSFNVISRQDHFEVTCYTGKVSVETSKDKVVLQAGEKSSLKSDEGVLDRSTFLSEEDSPQWMSGKFTFEDQPLAEVIEELERQYNIKVTYAPELSTLKYTGFFESGDLEEALSLITWPLHLKADIKGKTVTISR